MSGSFLDTTISFNGNTTFRNGYIGIANQLTKNTDFTPVEITSLLKVFYKFFKSFKNRSTDIRKLCAWFGIFGIVDEYIIIQILRYLNYDASKCYIDPRAWIHLMDIFFSNNIKEQIKYAFEIYDANEVGYLTTHDVRQRVHDYFDTNDEEENDDMRMDMVDLLFQKFDTDQDGTITFEEYQTVVMSNPLLLESFGKCLPSIRFRKCLILMQNLMDKWTRAERVIPLVVGDSTQRSSKIKTVKFKSTKSSAEVDPITFRQSRMELFAVTPSNLSNVRRRSSQIKPKQLNFKEIQ